MRYLGIDFGSKRTGLALSDPLGVTCSPLGTLVEKDERALLSRIADAAAEQGVDVIVIGVPRPLRGGTNAQLEGVLSFRERLENEVSVPVLTWDERYTSKMAQLGRSRRAPQDAVAACYMLQSYLDSIADSTGERQANER